MIYVVSHPCSGFNSILTKSHLKWFDMSAVTYPCSNVKSTIFVSVCCFYVKKRPTFLTNVNAYGTIAGVRGSK